MIDLRVGKYEDTNRKKSGVISTLLTAILILLLFLPLFSHLNPPPGQEGILVNLGLPDEGQGDKNGAAAKVEPEEKKPATKPKPEEEKKTPPPPKPEPEPEPVEKKTIEVEDPEAIAIKKAKEKKKKEEQKKRLEEQKERERERQEELAEQREKERREAAEKAEKERLAKEKAAKAAEAKRLADQLAGGFGDGSGKGKTGTAGNQGDPNGDPNSKNLEGRSTGSGMVGGGLGSRGVKSQPKVRDNTQKQGRIVLRVCVDKNGKVTSAAYTQAGSNSADATLISIAKKNARAWKFNKGTVDKQCGTITYDFKLK